MLQVDVALCKILSANYISVTLQGFCRVLRMLVLHTRYMILHCAFKFAVENSVATCMLFET